MSEILLLLPFMIATLLLRLNKQVLTLCVWLFGVSFLHATLLVYEGFNGYGSGTMAGQSIINTIGLSGAYSGISGEVTFQATGLTFGSMLVSGGSVYQSNTATTGAVGVNLASTTAVTGTLYTSYLVSFNTSSRNDSSAAQLGVNTAATAPLSGRYFTSAGDGYNSTQTYVGYDTTPGAGLTVNATGVYLIISRFTNVGRDTAVTNGVATMWVLTAAQYGYFASQGFTDAALDAAAVGSASNNVYKRMTDTCTSGTWRFDGTGALQLSLKTSATGYAYTMDELRVGTTLCDVTGISPTSIPFTDQQNIEQLGNPGFENGFTGWIQGDATIQTTNVYSGTNAAQLIGSTNFLKQCSYRQIAVAGEVYSASCYASCLNLASSTGISLRFLDSNLTELSNAGLGTLRGTRSYRKYSVTNVRAPIGTAYVEVLVSSAKKNAGGTSYVDAFSLAKNTGLPIKLVSTYNSIGVTVLANDAISDCAVYYRRSDESIWHASIEPFFDSSRNEFRSSIVNLLPDTTYQVCAFIMQNGVTITSGGVTLSTWQSSPPIAQTCNISELYMGGKLNLTNMQGTPEGWIKIVGTGSSDVSADYAIDEAVLISNCAYVILENARITGGRRYGIQVLNSENIRINNCNVSGWARTPNFVVNGISYETAADVTSSTPINMDGGIFLNSSAQVTVERCYLHDPRLSANSWDYAHPAGPEGMVVNNSTTIGAGNHVVRYNDIIGSDVTRWNDGIEGYNNGSTFGSFGRDSDIHGNVICYGQDDGIEMDGGQENVRFFENHVQGFYCGVSVTPNCKGPSYLFRNLITRLADSSSNAASVIKMGGGDTYSKGFTYVFNNTFYSKGHDGIAGSGYGSDANRAKYFAVTRNNIIFNLNSSAEAICDEELTVENSFDYDNLWTTGHTSATVTYSAGQEAHGILNQAPTFVDAAHGDFRLLTGSSAIDRGMAIPNFAETYLGTVPDQGYLEGNVAALPARRPINITANHLLVTLTATAGGSSTSDTVILTIGDLGGGGSMTYSILKNNTTSWLNVTPASGTLNSNSTANFTVSVNTANVTAGTTRKAVFLVKLANGYSVPITVEATIN